MHCRLAGAEQTPTLLWCWPGVVKHINQVPLLPLVPGPLLLLTAKLLVAVLLPVCLLPWVALPR